MDLNFKAQRPLPSKLSIERKAIFALGGARLKFEKALAKRK